MMKIEVLIADPFLAPDTCVSHVRRFVPRLCVYFERPTDVAIIDTGTDIDISFSNEEPPLRSIVVTDIENFSPFAHGDN